MITLGRLLIGITLLALWQIGVMTGVLHPLFFGRPERILAVIVEWFVSGEIWQHLAVTIAETLMAFVVGTVTGVAAGMWLGLSNHTAALLDPFIKAANAMPRVILAPIFGMWFGLGMTSKVALGFTLVFFIVFFNVLQGVREVSPTVLNGARMLGATRGQLLRHVYLPAALSWVFSSLHVSVGMAFVGAVIAEYLGSARGIGYLILQAEGVFDVDTVFAGIVVLTACALVMDAIVGIVEKRLLVWQPRADHARDT
jgi:NitT/TauT family transport system permease protein